MISVPSGLNITVDAGDQGLILVMRFDRLSNNGDNENPSLFQRSVPLGHSAIVLHDPMEDETM